MAANAGSSLARWPTSSTFSITATGDITRRQPVRYGASQRRGAGFRLPPISAHNTHQPTEISVPPSTKTLALETSTRLASVALFDGAAVVAGRTLPREADTARGLTPALAEMLESAGWQPGDLDLIGVSIGPGSFTGLRIGVTTAKTLAYAAKTDIVAVDTLQAIATQAPAAAATIRVVCDAGRGEAYTATFARDGDDTLVAQAELSMISRDDWLASLDPAVTQTGAALGRWCRELADDQRFAEVQAAGVLLTDASCWTPTAETIGRLATAAYATGTTDDLWRLVPRYIRRSAAEEVWEAKHGGDG